MTSQDIAIIADLRDRLWRNAYRPVPIDSGCKYPKQLQWQILARQDPPWAVLHVHPWQCGTGVLGDGLRLIDEDINDPDRAAAMDKFILGNYGPSPMRYRDGSPRRLRIYRAAEGEPPKSYVLNETTRERVEILGRGNQAFCYGIHPDTGQPLKWVDGPDVWHRADLPVLTQAQALDILAYAASLIDATRATYRASDEPLPFREPSGDEWPVGDIRSALAAIPNYRADYDWWFRLTCGVFDACNGGAGGQHEWFGWSGQCSEFSEREADRLWRALYDKPVYYTAGTLYREAQQHDPFWDRPSYSGFTRLRIGRN